MQKCNENAANRYSYVGEVYNIGEKEIKNRILNGLNPEWKSLHENGYIHIHDLDAYGLTYNCLTFNILADFPYEKFKVYAVSRKITAYYDYLKSLFSDMGNEQSGGMALANYDNDTAGIFERIGVDVFQNEELIRSCTADFIEWCNGTHTRMGQTSYYVTLNIGLAKTEAARKICFILLDEFEKSGALVYKPNIVFKVCGGVNRHETDQNFDLYKKSLLCTAKKMIPTYLLCDSAPNKDVKPENIGIMGCRTRVVANRFGENSSIGRGNIANISINLPRLALETEKEYSDAADERKIEIFIEKWNRIMGNNPFAGCPNIQITNESPNFILENGVLYDKDKTNLIHYTISNPQTEFIVPDGVMCLGKHCFYACNNLQKIVIPESVIRFENNPFSGCEHLSVENHSPHYIIENGVIYNKFKTTIVACLNGSRIDCLRIPETVSLISRNSFWNCKGIKKIVITKNVDRIGYNPFAGCENLIIESENDNFVVKNGVVYDKTLTHILCATDKEAGKMLTVPKGTIRIMRSAFSGCKSLENIDFNGITYIDKSSFTNCVGLTDIYVPDTVTYIGEWAFAYCVNLKKVSIGKNTFVDKNAFNECPAVIERRN